MLRSLSELDRARERDKKLLGELCDAGQHEAELRRELNELQVKLPKLKSSLADAEKATTLLKAERQQVQAEIFEVEALLRGTGK